MRSTAYHLSISTAQADALFVSALQRSDEPSTTQIRQVIATTIRESARRAARPGSPRSTASTRKPRSCGCAGYGRW